MQVQITVQHKGKKYNVLTKTVDEAIAELKAIEQLTQGLDRQDRIFRQRPQTFDSVPIKEVVKFFEEL